MDQGVRIFPTAASVAQDLEPEYIAVAPDGSLLIAEDQNGVIYRVRYTGR